MNNKSLSRFESLARRLVEGSLSRLLGGRLQPLDVANRLAHVVEDTYLEGRPADCYRVFLHPDDYLALWHGNPDLPTELNSHLAHLTGEWELPLPDQPCLELFADASLNRQQVVVKPHYHAGEQDESTQVRKRGRDDFATLALQTVDAFLIVDGRRHVALDRPFMTIGRHIDNDIVVDAPTVSRQHAQLRWRYGRFILYDLGSRGGTLVNGQPVTESVLQPGDVIVLSDVPLIYGEGLTDVADRRPRPLSHHNEATVTLVRRSNGENRDDLAGS
jgi:hypothetical protein